MKLSSVFVNMQLLYEHFVIWMLNHWRVLFALILCGVLALVGSFGYKSYRASAEEDAHKAFLNVTRVVKSEVSAEAKKNTEKRIAAERQKNEALMAACDLFLGKHGGSSYAPAVHAFMARALISAGSFNQAREHFIVAKKDASSIELKQVYALSVALLDVDSAEESTRLRGVEELKELCENETSSVYDAALFYLGEYFWQQKNYQEARLWWAQLIQVTEKKVAGFGAEIKSPWAAQAKERVALLDC